MRRRHLRYELDNEDGEPRGDCVYSKLCQAGYTRVSLASVDEKEWDSLKFLCNWAFAGNTIGDKARPGGLKIARIAHHCKWGISAKLDQDDTAVGDKDAFQLPYIFREIGDFETKSDERTHAICKPNGYLRGGDICPN